MKHFFSQSISHIPLPEKFTYPFHYTPHPLCVLATEEVKAFIETQVEWQEELSLGKMFGVLIVQDNEEVISYLAAFSGNLAGKNLHPFFVPPVYDLLQPQGFFKIEEAQISTINSRIKELETAPTYLTLKQRLKTEIEQATVALTKAKAELKANKEARELRRRSVASLSEEEQTALIKESQFQKANFKRLEREWKKLLEERKAEVVAFETAIEDLKMERKERSATLQQKLFEQFRMLNAKGEVKDLCTIFKETVHKIPPGGAGECALPKLLQYAYLHQLKPLAMAEFWWGNSPKTEVRHHGYYYPSCKGKCEPILKHMLQGLEMDENPLTTDICPHMDLEIVFEDEWLLVVNKPSGMLSVPGKIETADSVYQRVREKYPNATGPMIVHRLDMATSGLLLIAKTKEVHQHLQAQFENHTIKKRYIALLDESKLEKPIKKNGRIELPLCLNPLDRPRQMVSEEYGKTAITDYQVLESSGEYIRILFYPQTGRTHQLRIHAAHPQGLGCPIVGDELYGMKANRLYLHAEYIEFCHPVYGETICLQKEAEF
ncbi:RluA family pseudouridine synthase [Bacteroides faecalis]|uniref:RNA pseudouridine synthase n=1 Tax=Bacteroides faecalis TaxID=2447885 RepID=A0A401LUI1_9BACE|nr:RluA family pseudouridine synthase [Bacteroides faecalis]GCB35228.1 RNA pseudouridine synthase [Bacteroides faecalis]